MKKKLLIILFILILCGCTVKENVVVNRSGKVSQKVTFLKSTKNMSKQNFENYVDSILKEYGNALSARKYTINKMYDKNNSKIIFNNSFDNICDYFEKTIFSQYIYKHISCSEDEYYYVIKNETEHIDYCVDCLTWPSLDNVNFSITFPFKLDAHDADSVDNYTYTWYFDKNTPSDKSVYMKISKEKLKSAKELYEKNAKTNRIVNKILKTILVVVLMAFVGYATKKLYNLYKKNDIKY